ncbi:ABC transporter permease [Chitinophaga filiformis]|uniref:ABC-type antimicrobial peptide transport system, permease component n=1 Tax=Chitinophaga filiformis TaxID=104663 RepID=A0A1G8CID1_CHIFI|nr:ABC transporter permease [Chitinophaga filiformis]SDH45129.1 ABC-type antimicrobial peptide transport system, permease component [Chitinophaga filiformis]
MLKNYFVIAWRNLIKNKVTTFINIGGLTVGMAVAMLIGLWIWDELSFDTYNTNYPSIAKIARSENMPNGEVYISDNSNHFPIPLAEELRRNYNNYFTHVALASENIERIIKSGDKQFSRQGMYVEKDFTDILTLKMLAGSVKDFAETNTILLKRSLATSLYGDKNPVGQVLQLDNKQSLKVIGVFEDLPYNTTFRDVSFFCPWNLLVSTEQYVKDNLNNWGNSSFNIFASTVPGIPMEEISGKIKDVYQSKLDKPTFDSKTTLFLHPMKDWHLRAEWKNGIHSGGKIQLVWLFGLIGMFVLFLACINFMNLSTARSEKRAREVGIRKTFGSLRSQLIKQFMSESLLIVCVAFILSIGMVILSLNWFNEIADKKMVFPFSNPIFWLIAVVFIIITAVVAGSYPAFYLSSFQPLKVLKGAFRAGGSITPRRVMVTLQFTVSIILIIGTIVVYRQVQFAQNRPIGYDRNGLIKITMKTPGLNGKYDVLQHELLASGGAINFAQSSSPTTQSTYFDDRFEWENKDPQLPKMAFSLTAVTYDFGKTVGWKFKSGRDFSRSFPTDNAAIILNEAAVKYMQLKDPVGKIIRWNGNPYTVVGVIENMVTESPYKPVQQSVYFMIPGIGPVITIRLNPRLSAGEAISKIEPIFRKLDPSSPFEYKFVDDEYGRKFAAEQRIGALSTLFTCLAIFISCLGIFGLASFIAEQRMKEIGIRKILGASIASLWGLLSREFVTLVFVAFLIATPAAYYFLDKWLQQYDYHTTIAWWIFIIAGVSALVITLFTVSFQAVKAALANPVRSLQRE